MMVLYIAASVEFLTETNDRRGGYGNKRMDAYLAAAVGTSSTSSLLHFSMIREVLLYTSNLNFQPANV
jgi:hypothetical protein